MRHLNVALDKRRRREGINLEEKELLDRRHKSRLKDRNVRVVRVAKCERQGFGREAERCDGKE